MLAVQFGAQRLPQPQNGAISDTFFTQHFQFFDNRRKIESRKTRFVARYSLKPKDEKLKKLLKLKTERSSLEHYAPKTYLRMSTS